MRAKTTVTAIAVGMSLVLLAGCGGGTEPAATPAQPLAPTVPILPTGPGPNDNDNCGDTTSRYEGNSLYDQEKGGRQDCVSWSPPQPPMMPLARVIELQHQTQGPPGRLRNVGAAYLCAIAASNPDLDRDFGHYLATFGPECIINDRNKNGKPSMTLSFEVGTVRVGEKINGRAHDSKNIETTVDGTLIKIKTDSATDSEEAPEERKRWTAFLSTVP